MPRHGSEGARAGGGRVVMRVKALRTSEVGGGGSRVNKLAQISTNQYSLSDESRSMTLTLFNTSNRIYTNKTNSHTVVNSSGLCVRIGIPSPPPPPSIRLWRSTSFPLKLQPNKTTSKWDHELGLYFCTLVEVYWSSIKNTSLNVSVKFE